MYVCNTTTVDDVQRDDDDDVCVLVWVLCMSVCLNYPVQTNARSSGFRGKLEKSLLRVLLVDFVCVCGLAKISTGKGFGSCFDVDAEGL